jgi:hypothetical protein
MHKTLLLAALALSAIACPPLPSPDPPEPVATGGSAPASDDCEAASDKLEELACPDMYGFLEGCRLARRDGLEWHQAAIACSTTCEEAEAAWRGEVDPCR